ncbi:MAG: SpoIID/LytB domain-containing protein [Acidimicrobiales bacterium]
MRVRSPTACALVILAAVAFGPVLAPPGAAGADASPGWVVDRVRFEPVASGGALTVDGSGTYRGAIEVVPAAGGLAVIDDVGLQDYLKGIAEVPPEWPAAALQAQAIAARTYALYQKATPTDASWRAAGADICPTDACQVYAGTAAEQRAGAERWAAAVDDTTGSVLLYGGQPLRAMYSASNGGRSVAGGEPYLKSVADPDDARSPLGHWHWATPLGALAPLLGVAPPLVLTGVARRGAVVVFATKAPDGTAVQHEVGVDDFRSKVDDAFPAPAGLPMALPSSAYTVASDGTSAIFDGRGFGHGEGMSQYGALGKAQRGMSAADILAAYYGGIRPSVLPPDQLPATVRVGLAEGRRSVTVSPERYFTIASGSGAPIGGVELGRWRVQPAPGGVRLVPPAGRDEPLSVKAASVAAAPQPAGAPVVHFDLTAPAVVTVRYVTPTGQPGAVPAQVVDAGDVAQPLPPPGSGGDYQVLIEADGGPGRFLSVPLQLRVDGPSRVAVGTIGAETPTGGGRRGWLAVAVALVVAMGVATGAAARRPVGER